MADLSLEIRHLDVSGGDSTAILVKDLEQEADTGGKTIYSMLIDAGAEAHGSAYLKTYLKEHKLESFDCIVATHYHQDHIQGFSQAKIKFQHFLDNGAYPHESGNTFSPRNDIGKGSKTAIFTAYREQVQSQVKNTAKRIEIPFIQKDFDLKKAEPLKLKLGEHTGVTLTCYCANGILANGKDILGGQKKKKSKDISPNDVSLAFVLEWGDFRYLTAGDLSGDRDLSSYYNIEEHLVKYLTDKTTGPLRNKPITVFKASHHGSEHSNHADLLNTLKPDTIIVCCNIQKQVPSPLFLGRLGAYFTTQKTATAVFTNTMKIFKNDDRYAPLVKIKDSIAKDNVAFAGKDGEEQIASNLGIKCAIIRRRVHDGRQCAYDDTTLDGVQITKKGGYEIMLMPRAKDEAEKIEKSVKFVSYEIKHAWKEKALNRSRIVTQFRELAKAMCTWIRKDNKFTATEGNDYIAEHYPGLIKTINTTDADTMEMENALVKEMERMFDSSFVLKGEWFRKKDQNLLTSDEQRTFYAILVNNFYQVAWNGLSPQGGKRFDKEKSWNYADFPEPYSTGGLKHTRGPELEPDDRKFKKPKTS